jgi:MFS family permease
VDSGGGVERPTAVPIWALFAANAISMVGNVLAALAIPWFVLQTTGSAAKTGVTGFFEVLPVVLAGFLGGTIVDRMGYKRTSIVADIASSLAVLLIPLLHFTIGLQFWELMVLVFLGGLLDAPGSTARSALIPELAGMAKMPLERATSLDQVIERTSRLVGAPLAGVLIAAMGTANVLWLDGASFIVSAVIVAALVPKPHTEPTEAEPKRYWDELMDGLKYLRAQALIFAVVIVVMVTNFLDSAFSGVVLPVYVKQVFNDPVNLGLIMAAFGGGSAVGALIYGAVAQKLPRLAVFVLSFALFGASFFVFAAFPPLAVLLVAAALAGVFAGPINPIIDAVLYERIATDMRGRVLGTVKAGAWLMMPLGMLLGGVLTEAFGVRALMIGLGAVYLITTLSAGFIPAMRQMDERVAQQAMTGAGVAAEE